MYFKFGIFLYEMGDILKDFDNSITEPQLRRLFPKEAFHTFVFSRNISTFLIVSFIIKSRENAYVLQSFFWSDFISVLNNMQLIKFSIFCYSKKQISFVITPFILSGLKQWLQDGMKQVTSFKDIGITYFIPPW